MILLLLITGGDREIAAAVTIIRHAWVNRAPAITLAMVAALHARQTPGGQGRPPHLIDILSSFS